MKQETALEIASVLLQNTLEKNISDYNVRKVSYDKNEKVWVVRFIIDESTAGGDINFSLSQKTGEVKLIWFGE